MNVSHKFTRQVPLGLVTFVIGISGLALVAYFANDLVEFAATASTSAAWQTESYYPTPIIRAP
jgi:hypothetical protein